MTTERCSYRCVWWPHPYMQLCLNYQMAWWEDIQVYKEFHQNKLSWVVRLKRWQARYSQVNVNTSGCKNRTQGWVLGSQSQSQLYGDRSSDEGMNGPIAVVGNSQWQANTNGEACLWFTCIWIECFIDIMLQMNLEKVNVAFRRRLSVKQRGILQLWPGCRCNDNRSLAHRDGRSSDAAVVACVLKLANFFWFKENRWNLFFSLFSCFCFYKCVSHLSTDWRHASHVVPHPI